MIIMLPKLWLQLSILLDHDDGDEYHPNRNAMKIANIIYNERDDESYSYLKAMIMRITISNNSMILIITMLDGLL
jgi:gluconate kinase